MGVLDNVLGSAVPGGNLAKPSMIVLIPAMSPGRSEIMSLGVPT